MFIDQIKRISTDPRPRFRNGRRLGILLSLFLLSVLVRTRYINRPLSSHYEWVTAPILITLQTWHEEGLWKHRFLQVMTYPGKANRNISNDARMSNSDGVWYYTSRPPMAWLAPYFVFKLLGVYPDVLPLQIFNLVLHFVCVVLIYLLVHQLLLGKSFAAREPPAFIAAIMYLFNPFTLWFHCNTYSAQWLNHPLLIAGTYVFIRILDSEEKDKKRWIITMGVLAFFMFYTAWYGVFFSTIVCLYALIHHKERSMRWLITAVVGGAACALLLALIQMSTISGLGALLKFFLGRFTFISGYFEETDKNMHIYDPAAWVRVFNHYYKGFGGFLLFFAIVMFVATALGGDFEKRFTHLDKRWLAAACITVLTVLGHHLTLFNHTTIHEYSVMPMFISFSMLTGLGLSSVISKLEETRDNRELTGNIASILVVVLILSFVSIGDYREQNAKGHNLYKAMGETIRKNAKDDEVVFVEKLSLYLTGYGSVVPHVVFYAHRNIATWQDAKTAQELLAANGAKRGIIFKLVKSGKQYQFPHRYIERAETLSDGPARPQPARMLSKAQKNSTPQL